MGGRGDGHEDFGFEAHLGEGGGGGLRKGYARGEEGDGVEDREVGAVEGCEEAKALDHKVPRGGDLGSEVGGVGGGAFISCS